MTEWGTNRRGRQHRERSEVGPADLCATINWLVSRDGLGHGGGESSLVGGWDQAQDRRPYIGLATFPPRIIYKSDIENQ